MNKETIELLGSYLQIKGLVRQRKLQRKQYEEMRNHCAAKNPGDKEKIQSYDYRIEEIDIEVKNYTNQIRSLSRTLDDLRRTLDNPRFNVFYFHYVKGYSLQKTADKVGYSKAGVVKICRTIRQKMYPKSIPKRP